MSTLRALANYIVILATMVAGLVLSTIIASPVRIFPLVLALLLSALKLISPVIKRSIVTYNIDDTLVYLLTHMYAVSTGKPPRKRIFELQTIVGGYGEYDSILKRIAVLAVDWGFGFRKAINVVAKTVRNKVFRDFLHRFGELLNIGEDPEIFLDVERRAILTEYQAHYTRVLEASKLLLGIYTSGISSAIFLVITFMIFTFLFPASPLLIILVYIAITTALSTLVYVLYKFMPRDRVTHNLGYYPPERRRYRVILIMFIMVSIVIGLIAYTFFRDPYIAMSIAASPLLVPGFYAKRIEKKIKSIESFFPIFLRSFGLTYSTVPHVPTALASVLRSNYGPLTKYLYRILARLTLGVDPETAWRRFVGETWSEIVRINVNVLYDCIDVGGDLSKVGTVLSETTFRILDMRKQRIQLAKAFESTIYIIHSLFSAILSFVLTLLNIFHSIISRIQSIGGNLPSILPFQPSAVELATTITPPFILALAILNAITIKIAQGGMYETVWVPIALLIMLSGMVMYLVNIMAGALFANVMGLSQLLSSI